MGKVRRKFEISLSAVTLLFMVMFLVLAMQNVITAEAASDAVLLKSGKTYQYDLDKDGKKESIRLKHEDTNKTKDKVDHTITDTLSINGKVVYKVVNVCTLINSKKPYEGEKISATYYINGKKKRHEKITRKSYYGLEAVYFFLTDTDKKDKQMELIAVPANSGDLYWEGPAQPVSHIWYCSYQKGIFTEKQDLCSILKLRYGKQFYSVHGYLNEENGEYVDKFETDGKGTLSFMTCLEVNTYNLHIDDSLKLKNGEFTAPDTKEYKVRMCPYYKSKSKTKIYTTLACKKVLFTLKKNDVITVDGICPQNKGAFYVRITKYKEAKDEDGYSTYVKDISGYVKLSNLRTGDL